MATQTLILFFLSHSEVDFLVCLGSLQSSPRPSHYHHHVWLLSPPGLDSFFLLNKWNHHFKTAFCIYLHYLCVILKLVWWSESFKCDKYAKKIFKQEGGKNLFTALYIYMCMSNIYIYIYIYRERERSYTFYFNNNNNYYYCIHISVLSQNFWPVYPYYLAQKWKKYPIILLLLILLHYFHKYLNILYLYYNFYFR